MSTGEPRPLAELLRESLGRGRPSTNDPSRVPDQRPPLADATAARVAAHRQAQQEARAEHLISCGVGRLDVERLAAGLSAEWEACRVARTWWRTPEPLLLLLGAPGTGKTLAASELVAACRLGYQDPELGDVWCWPSTVSERGHVVLSGELATSSYYGQDAEKQRHRLIGYRLLVIDELGTEVQSPPWQSLLDTLVNQRMRAKRKTVLLSNLDEDAFCARYGARVSRRIRDEGLAVSLGPVTMTRPRPLPPPRDGRAAAVGEGES